MCERQDQVMNNQFFGGMQYSQEDLQRRVKARRSQSGASLAASGTNTNNASGNGNGSNNGAGGGNVPGMGNAIKMNMPSAGALDAQDMMGGDSLDDIIMQNNSEMFRRQSLPQVMAPAMSQVLSQSMASQYGGDAGQAQDGRPSMMAFGSNASSLSGFQFDAQPGAVGPNVGARRQSLGDHEMVNGFPDMSSNMSSNMPSNMPSAMDMARSLGPYSTSLQANPLAMDTGHVYNSLQNDMMGGMMSAYPPVNIEGLDAGPPPLDIYAPPIFPNPYQNPTISTLPTVPQDLPPLPAQGGDMRRGSIVHGEVEVDNDAMAGVPSLSILGGGHDLATNVGLDIGMGSYTAPSSPTTIKSHNRNSFHAAPSLPSTVTTEVQGPAKPPPPPQPSYENIYSSSGFDMLGALIRVANRKNPEINIGAVDMSCAFVVCDITQSDTPIVYVSEIFERLTRYNKHEVLGRNCRFLQAPDGKVMPGVKRQYVDDDSVHYLKSRITQCKEAQRSLINYRKGGQPFMNLLTMIPIPWDTDEIKYFVGFQVDLVEQPNSIANKNSGGSYTVNYSQSLLPRYVWQPPEGHRHSTDNGQTISRDDVTAVLTSFNSCGDSELSKRMWDKVLLENTDDVVHVLSLKGLFLYLSPSSRHVLEYDSSELVGTALSSVCHPSDIVPVTRELKDTSTGAPVNVVFRIRRKRSGYTWFESHGSLCVEQGKGRKCIILVGRERPVYTLARHDIQAAGGIGENELWTKLSTSGMFLFVSSNVRTLLDRQAEDLIGTSIQALMRAESKTEFGRSLERARTGQRVDFKHEVLNKRGQVLQAQTTLYPGDALEGQKPTFLVAQTRLLKSARAGAPALSPVSPKSLVAPHKLSRESSMHSIQSASDMRAIEMTPTTSSASYTAQEGNSVLTQPGGLALPIISQSVALASASNIFDELKTTRCTSWQFELRQMEKSNRLLAEELAGLLASKKKRKRRKGAGQVQRDCANCHTRSTPEWRRGPSGLRDLCNSCGLRWAKQVSRSPREGEVGSAGGWSS